MNRLNPERQAELRRAMDAGMGDREIERTLCICAKTARTYRRQWGRSAAKGRMMTPRQYRDRALPIVNALADSFPLAEVFPDGMCCAYCGLSAGTVSSPGEIENLHLRSRKKSVRRCAWLAARQLRAEFSPGENSARRRTAARAG